MLVNSPQLNTLKAQKGSKKCAIHSLKQSPSQNCRVYTHRNTNMHVRPWEEGVPSGNFEAKHLPDTGSQSQAALGRGSQFLFSQQAFPDLLILGSAAC